MRIETVKRNRNNYVNVRFGTREEACALRRALRNIGMKADPYYAANKTVRIYG